MYVAAYKECPDRGEIHIGVAVMDILDIMGYSGNPYMVNVPEWLRGHVKVVMRKRAGSSPAVDILANQSIFAQYFKSAKFEAQRWNADEREQTLVCPVLDLSYSTLLFLPASPSCRSLRATAPDYFIAASRCPCASYHY